MVVKVEEDGYGKNWYEYREEVSNQGPDRTNKRKDVERSQENREG
jgi:hypothetical protein